MENWILKDRAGSSSSLIQRGEFQHVPAAHMLREALHNYSHTAREVKVLRVPRASAFTGKEEDEQLPAPSSSPDVDVWPE